MLHRKIVNNKEPTLDFAHIGNVLKSVRLQKKLRISVVAKYLNLSEETIKNLEKGIINVAPGETFMKGFLKGYATYLGCQDVWNPIPIEDPLAVATPHAKTKLAFGSKGIFPTWFLMLSIIGIGAGLLARFGITHKDFFEKNELILPTAPTPQHFSLSEIENISKTIDKNTSLPQEKVDPPIVITTSFSLVFSAPVWLKLTKSDGNVLYEGTFTQKDTLSVASDFEGTLHAGNIGAIRIKYKDKESAPLGEEGRVVLKHSLTPSTLTQLFPN